MRFLHALLEIRKRSSKPDDFFSFTRERPFSTSRKKAPLRSRASSGKPLRKSKGKSKLLNNSSEGGGKVNNKLDSSRMTLATPIGLDCLGHGVEWGTVSIQKQIINTLCRGDRERASSLLLDLANGNQSLRANDLVYILRYCARSPDPLFAMQTWKIMEEKDIFPDSLCHLLTVQALCKGGYLEEAFNLLKFTGKSHAFCTSLSVYNAFLGASSKVQSFVHIKQCLDLMDKRMVGKNEVTYSELLKIAVWQKNLPAVNEIWEDYVKHFSLSITSLQKFISAFARLRDLQSAYQNLQQMVALAFQGSISIKDRTVSKSICYSRLDIPVLVNRPLDLGKYDLKENGKVDPLQANAHTVNTGASTIVDIGNWEVESCGMVRRAMHQKNPAAMLLDWSFGDVIHACAEAQNFGLAEQLMLQMQNLGLQPSSYVYYGFIKAVIHEKGVGEALKVLEVMRQGNLKPSSPTLATISVGCSKALQLDLAEALLDQISSYPYSYPYNEFFAACDTLDQPERAIKMFGKMRQLKIQPNVRTYELLFSLFGNVNAPYEDGNVLSQVESAKRINAIEMDMAKNGVQHSHASMMSLLKALGAEGMTRELVKYLQMAADLFSRNNLYHMRTPMYNAVMHSLVEAQESYLTIEVFRNMRANGVLPDSATYSIMIDCCGIMRCYKSSCALLSLMLRDGYYPQGVTYGTLIKVALDCGDFDESLRLLDQMISEKIQLDIVVYNTILKKACDKGRLDIIELIVEQMHREKVKPDPSTCSYVFSAYVSQNFHSTALEALQVLSLRMICPEENVVPEMEARLVDDLILSEDSEADVRILKLFGSSEENVAFALLSLRWCSIIGFPMSRFPNETIWARRTSTGYDLRREMHGRCL